MHKTILLIDDDEEEQLILTEALRETGTSVKCIYAVTIEEGMKMLQHLLPDFVFLDINMPIRNGFECLDIIKRDKNLHKIPVIIYSTGVDDSVFNKAIKRGAAACIKKEDNIKELADVLKRILF